MWELGLRFFKGGIENNDIAIKPPVGGKYDDTWAGWACHKSDEMAAGAAQRKLM